MLINNVIFDIIVLKGSVINLEEEKKEEVKNEEVKEAVIEEVKASQPKKKSKAPIIIPIVITLVIIVGALFIFLGNGDKKEDDKKETPAIKYSEYKMEDNTLSKFDLAFLKLENKSENKIYSPLSIKYALQMLSEGASGESKSQIDAVIGDYSSKKYVNSSNMSFGNALFVNENYKEGVTKDYSDKLKDKYDAELIYDPFTKPDTINKWVKDKTFNLIENLITEDISDNVFVLVNALAIDMEWVNKIQKDEDDYSVNFNHESFYAYVPELSMGFASLDFYTNEKDPMKAEAVKLAAVANRYDIVNELGEDKIRETVGAEYKKWLQSGECGDAEPNPSQSKIDKYLDTYIKEINENYKHLSSSTDFLFDVNDDYKVFAKDLKTYDNTTLQYIAIMPRKDSLANFVENTDENQINKIIANLKSIEMDSFEDGYVTKIEGTIPTFKFDYDLELMKDLQTIGITDVFDTAKADLSGISGEKGLFIDKAAHKANIEFSNNGIKAGAATSIGGKGAASCDFEYNYKVPTIEIDLTFDNPYLFIIRDKDTQEVWFIGTVYEPNEYKLPYYGY